MTDYTELVKALRCREAEWGYYTKCEYYGEASDNRCVRCDSDRLAKDAAAAIEALQAQLPKQGEWIWIQKANGGQYKGCSVCHAPIPTDSMLDYLDDEDCDFCYSCGAKMMEVQE